MFYKHFNQTFNNSDQDHWIVSDPHFGHKNLVRGISNWTDKSGCRPFPTQQKHDQTMVGGINSVVQPEDVLWVIGDWCFGGIQNIWEFRKQVNCKTIYFLLGNHDKHIRSNKNLIIPEEDHGWDLDEVHHQNETKGRGIFSFQYNNIEWNAEYHIETGQLTLRAQDLFDWVADRIETKIFGQRVVFDHFAKRVWNKSHKGYWLIHGHSHGSLPEYTSYYAGRPDEDEIFRTMDVGFECAYETLGEWRPFKFQEIQKMMAGRPPLFVDHHDENTNE